MTIPFSYIVRNVAARRLTTVLTAGGKVVATRAASMYRSLRGDGVTVRSSIDLLIGAWCIENDCSLIHSDRDFDAMPGHGLQFWSQ